MSIKLKLTLGFTLMVVVLALQGILAMNVFNDQTANFKHIVHINAEFETLSKEIDISMLTHRRFEKDYFINIGNRAEQEGYKEKLLNESERMQEKLGRLKTLAANIPELDPKTKEQADGLGKEYEAYLNGLMTVMGRIEADPSVTTRQADSIMQPYKASIRQLEEDIDLIAGVARKGLQEFAIKSEAESDAALKTLSILLGGGVLTAVLAALLISLSITRPLKKLAAFAERTSKGDFEADTPKAGGEIGELIRSVLGIREAVAGVLSRIDRSDDLISQGHILERIDPSEFEGRFSTLAERVNSMADTLTGFLEEVPAPVMLIDKNYKVLYLNKTGTDAGAAEHRSQTGRQCYDFFRTDDCRTENCACAKAMKTGSGASSATTARPGPNELEISYIAKPVTNRKGEVVGALEIVVDQTAIVHAQRKMTELASRAAEISERVTTASEELSAQVEQVSKGADIQRARIGETATAMEQMNATVLEVARNASQASGSAEMARDNAGKGAEIVEKSVSAINRVHTITTELKSNMAQLGEQAESIGDVMGVISDIADQTNLLALNAAIEAARAGDAGRGFAVVADEVRKLAEKTMTATSEVGQKIQAIQEASMKNIQGMDTAAEAVEEATDMAGQSGDSLKDIVRLSDDSAGMVQSIAAAAEEQSAASEQINRAVEEVNAVVSETADGMSQSAQAVLELTELTVDLKNLIDELHGGEMAA